MNTFKLYIIVCATFLFSNSVAQENQAYEDQGSSFMDKVFVGGGIGAGFGYYTYVSISPIIGYRITPKLSAALRLMYQYTTYDYYDYQENRYKTYSGNNFGVGGFARYTVYGPVYLQVEYEHLNSDGLYPDGSTSRTSFDSYMAGGGIAQPVGGKAFMFITAMYNFSYDNFDSNGAYRSPYDSPWVIRIGITAGF